MSESFVPLVVASYDLADPALPAELDVPEDHRLRLLVRLLERPLGFVELAVNGPAVDIGRVREQAAVDLADAIARRLAELGLPADSPLAGLPEQLASHARPFSSRTGLPPVTVVLSTRERPDSLRRALRSLRESSNCWCRWVTAWVWLASRSADARQPAPRHTTSTSRPTTMSSA